jgi:hypothetical protein
MSDGEMRRLKALMERSQGDSQEAQTCAALAQKLARQLATSIEAVALETGRAEESITRPSDVVIGGIRQRKWQWDLAWVVASAHGCVPWTQSRYTLEVENDAEPLTPELDLEHLRGLFDRKGRGGVVVRVYDDALPWRPGFGRKLQVTTLYGGHRDRSQIRWLLANEGPGLDYEDLSDEQITVEQLLVMVGKRALVEAADYVYRFLLGEVEATARQRGKGRGRLAMNSLRMGLVAGLSQRLEEEQTQALAAAGDSEEARTQALVLVREEEESKRTLADAIGYDPYSDETSKAKYDYTAFHEGVQAAEDIEVPDSNSTRSSAHRAGRILGAGA